MKVSTRSIADAFDVSTMPVREALKKLDPTDSSSSGAAASPSPTCRPIRSCRCSRSGCAWSSSPPSGRSSR
ncbi:hypothetical protein [Herbiconiux sp. UC225_62]|uniref:hypothetical protein n=1 Tax=Herbiconiux sp. UC225_62 TaxID=3350168 RepID=UPI0036D2C869